MVPGAYSPTSPLMELSNSRKGRRVFGNKVAIQAIMETCKRSDTPDAQSFFPNGLSSPPALRPLLFGSVVAMVSQVSLSR